jgi:hypothetical protein
MMALSDPPTTGENVREYELPRNVVYDRDFTRNHASLSCLEGKSSA